MPRAKAAVQSPGVFTEKTPAQQLAGFLDKFTPEIEKFTNATLQRMRARLPGAVELVYDNYNALAIGFGPTSKTSEAIFSIAVYPRWVSLFFLAGKGLADPHGILKGSGNQVRHIVLQTPDDIDEPRIKDLMDRALADADRIPDRTLPGRIEIKSISAKQRPRRP